MKIRFLGSGIWARGLTSMAQFRLLLKQQADLVDTAFAAPKPEAIPAKERRRAGLLINLAVEVAHQACEQANVDKRAVASVFTSAMGDTAITDYMCRKLTAPEKLLSPTKFHNSVHNAPSGYWTISADNRAPSSFVGGFSQSFGAGLLEAASQACAAAAPVLLVAYDIANQMPFADIQPVQESLGAAFVVAPAAADCSAYAAPSNSGNKAAHTAAPIAQLSYRALGSQVAVDSTPATPALTELAKGTPMGGALALLEALAQPASAPVSVHFAAAPHALLDVCFTAGAIQ